jgi:translation initiation factor IF-1
MKKLLLIALLLTGSVAFGKQPTPVGAWLPAHAKWQHAPADVAPNLITTSTRVLYFQPDGKAVVIDCIVNRERGRYTTISSGDGQVVAVGEWHREQGRIVMRSQTVLRIVPKVGEKLPGPWSEDVLRLKGDLLLLNGVSYRREPELEKSAAEMVPHPNPPQP